MKPKLKTVRKKKKIIRMGEQILPPKEWIACHKEIQVVEHRDMALKWVLIVFSITVACTFCVLLLAGFKVCGFALPESLLNKIGWAAIGQSGGLVGVAFKCIFKA